MSAQYFERRTAATKYWGFVTVRYAAVYFSSHDAYRSRRIAEDSGEVKERRTVLVPAAPGMPPHVS